MADELKKTMSEIDEFLNKLGIAPDKIQQIDDKLKGTLGKNDVLAKAKKDADAFAASLTPLKDKIDQQTGAFGALLKALYNAGDASMSAGQQFNAAWAGTGVDKAIGGIDEVTKMSKEFRKEAQGMGSQFGMGFDEASKGYQNYNAAILHAQTATYESREQIMQYTKELAQHGVTLGEIAKVTDVAGHQENMLTMGLLLAADSGLSASAVFDMMATATRKMGLSAEDSTKPLLAIETLARSTGLPVSDLSKKIFGLAEDNARFGTTVESLSPIVKRFASTLGDGFKGFAIQDTARLIQGLAGQVGNANAAFMAMQSGAARPGAGAAGAMMDYESAMAKPEEAMKMLSASLSKLGGGQILKFEQAHGDPVLENQFMIQRKMLEQLTGINDPQQTRTLMALLSEQQSGKQLSVDDSKKLEDAMKSGHDKQEESRSLADKIGKAQVLLLSELVLNTSNTATKLLTPQVESAYIGRGTNQLAEYKTMAEAWVAAKAGNVLERADAAFANFTPKFNSLSTPEQRIGGFNPGESALIVGGQTSNNIPDPIRPTVSLPAQSQPGAPGENHSTKTTEAPGAKGESTTTILLRGEGVILDAIAKASKVVINKLNHGNS